jgi:fluoroquinolone transport system permease protein
MKRLLSTVRWDVLIQFRQGFYYVSVFFVLVCAVLLRQLPHDGRVNFGIVIPAFMVLNLLVTTFYFIGALVLLEKGEGTLAGLIVTPLRDVEYLLSKILSLLLLALLESLLIVVLSYGFAFQVVPLLAGMILLGALYTLLGFIAIARYDSINEYLLPAGVMVALLTLPLIDQTGLWHSWLFYLHPVQPALVLMSSAFAPLAPWESIYAVLGSLFWVGLSFVLARHIFLRFVVRSAGS